MLAAMVVVLSSGIDDSSVDGLIAHKRTFSDRVVALHSLAAAHYPQDGRPDLIDSLTKSDQFSDWRHSKLADLTGMTGTLDRQDGYYLAICLSGEYADRYGPLSKN